MEDALARKLAKAVVAAGAAPEGTATLAIFPGDAVFQIASLRDRTGAALDPRRWVPLIDFSLAAAGEQYALTPVSRISLATGASPRRNMGGKR